MNIPYIPKPYEIYKHFKGNCYQILCIATNSEDGEQEVIYQGLYAPYKIYARKLEMFMEKVDKEKYPDATQEYRFELLDSNGFVIERKPVIDSKMQQEVVNDSVMATDVSRGEVDTDRQDKNINKDKDIDIEDNLADEPGNQTQNTESAVEKGIEIRDAAKAEIIRKRREESSKINPILVEFLDARTDDEQLDIIVKYREVITEDILVPMELSLGMEVGEGRLSDRIYAIRNCLELRKRYERSNRNS